MKRHMSGWEVLFIVLGVLCMIGAVGCLLLVDFASLGVCIGAGLVMFMSASVCAWMDDLLEAVSRPKVKEAGEPVTMSAAEKELRARSEGGRRRNMKQEAAPTMADMYRNARESE